MMWPATSRFIVPPLALALLAAAPARPPVGFADLAALARSHPLHAVLLEYDREITALQSTQSVARLNDAAQRAREAATAARRDAATAQAQVQRIAARADQYRADEGAVLAAVLASRDAGDSQLQPYAGALSRETNANVGKFAAGIEASDARAYAARAQQLREKELTLAFDLARQDAGMRLRLRLKLDDLHLMPAKRAALHAELAALDAAELQAVNRLRRRDAATLAAFRDKLQSRRGTADAQMAADLERKAAANFALRKHVGLVESQSAAAMHDLPAGIGAFASGFALGAEAANVTASMRAAGADLGSRFTQLAASATQSDRETAAQIRTLTADRAALYRSILSEIVREAKAEARRHGLSGVAFAGPRPRNSVDLTPAVQAALTQS